MIGWSLQTNKGVASYLFIRLFVYRFPSFVCSACSRPFSYGYREQHLHHLCPRWYIPMGSLVAQLLFNCVINQFIRVSINKKYASLHFLQQITGPSLYWAAVYTSIWVIRHGYCLRSAMWKYYLWGTVVTRAGITCITASCPIWYISLILSL